MWKQVEVCLNKDNIIKYLLDRKDLYCEWYNLENEESYSFNLTNKLIYDENIMHNEFKMLLNLPSFIEKVKKDNKFNFIDILKVRYIIPAKYEGKDCYKVVTKNEVVMIDKNTYLPVYSKIKIVNSNSEMKNTIENSYEFEVGNVTDEDMALPDLSQFQLVKSK